MKKEEVKQDEPKQEVENVELPKGSYYFTQVPESMRLALVKDEKEVSIEELIVRMANALVKAGILVE